MKTTRRILLSLLCSAGVLTSAPAEDELPVMIRVYLEFIRIPHETMTEVMAGPAAERSSTLHGAFRKLVKEKKASIMESTIAVARPGQRMTVESIMEHISPSEFDPPGFVPAPVSGAPGSGSKVVWLRPETPTAFECRNVGVTLEIEPNIGANEKIIDLRFAPELSRLLRLETWQEHTDRWGEASLRRPVFETMRVSTSLTLVAGEFTLAGTLTPALASGGPDPEDRVLLFVRGDLVRVEPGKPE